MPSEAIRATLDADMIINAKVITVDATFSLAHRVAIKNGKVVGVEAGIRRFAGPKNRVLDAQGKAVARPDRHARACRGGWAPEIPCVVRRRPINPLVNMSISITRKDWDGAVYGPKQAVSREEVGGRVVYERAS